MFSFAVQTTKMAIDKRTHIIECAAELFATKGYEATSIRDLAKTAEVNIAMINYYFGSKEKLFEALVETKAAYMKNVIQSLAEDESISELDKIYIIAEKFLERILSQPHFHKIIQQELLINRRMHMHKTLVNIITQNIQTFTGIIQSGVNKKIFKPIDAPLLYATIIGTINQVISSSLFCHTLLNSHPETNIYTDEQLKSRLIQHIRQVIASHLLIQ